jgi:hypothetical protein
LFIHLCLLNYRLILGSVGIVSQFLHSFDMAIFGPLECSYLVWCQLSIGSHLGNCLGIFRGSFQAAR